MSETPDAHSMITFQVREIIAVEEHPDPSITALWALQVKIDPEQPPRSICAGLRSHLSAEELLNRRVVVASNLPPRTLRGVRSEGMILCACRPKDGEPTEEVVPISPPVEAPIGSRVLKEGHEYQGKAPQTLSKKQFSRHYEAVASLLKTDTEGNCLVGDSRLVVDGVPVTGLPGAIVR